MFFFGVSEIVQKWPLWVTKRRSLCKKARVFLRGITLIVQAKAHILSSYKSIELAYASGAKITSTCMDDIFPSLFILMSPFVYMWTLTHIIIWLANSKALRIGLRPWYCCYKSLTMSSIFLCLKNIFPHISSVSHRDRNFVRPSMWHTLCLLKIERSVWRKCVFFLRCVPVFIMCMYRQTSRLAHGSSHKRCNNIL